MAATVQKRVEAEFSLAMLHLGLLAPGITHDVPLHQSDGTSGDAAAQAQRLRGEWEMTSGAALDIVTRLEAHGVVCMWRYLDGLRTSALAATSENGSTLMFVDPRAEPEVTLWAIAHELGHLVLHSSSLPDNEAAADEFASEFLAPRAALQVMLESAVDPDELPEKFHVPPPNLAVHARRERLITVADYRRLRTHSLPPWPRDALAGPSRLAEIVRERATGGELVSEIARAAHLTEDDLRQEYLGVST